MNLAYELHSIASPRTSYWRNIWANLCSRNNCCICHELFFWPFFLVGFCTPIEHRTTVVAWFHIWFLVPSEVIWISPGLPFPCGASDGAGNHMAQIRLAKSASESSTALTTQLFSNYSAKQHSQATAVNYIGSELSLGEQSVLKKKHFWSENSREHC